MIEMVKSIEQWWWMSLNLKRLIAKYFAPMGRLELLVRSNGISWGISNMHIFKLIIMGKGIVDRFPKLSKISFSVKCFTSAFSRFSSTDVKMFLLGGRLGARHWISISVIFLKFPKFLNFKSSSNSWNKFYIHFLLKIF